MKEHVTYCVEYRRDDVPIYQLSFYGFKDKDVAIHFAEKASTTLHARVVEQRRKVIKVFSASNPIEQTQKTAG